MGIREHPDWYPGLSSSSRFEDMQMHMHSNGLHNCQIPCGTEPREAAATPVEDPNKITAAPTAEQCHTAVAGEECHSHIQWAMTTGIREHPDWYSGLSISSRVEDVQMHMHKNGLHNCPIPCGAEPR